MISTMRSSERLGTRCFFLDLLAIRSASGGGLASSRCAISWIRWILKSKIRRRKGRENKLTSVAKLQTGWPSASGRHRERDAGRRRQLKVGRSERQLQLQLQRRRLGEEVGGKEFSVLFVDFSPAQERSLVAQSWHELQL
jgi:hypothetical protein